MAGQISIKPEELIARANEISVINDNMTGKLNSIKSQMDNLESSWDSTAGKKIREAMNSLSPKFKEYQDVVNQYVTFLKDTAGSYVTTDDTATTSVNQVQFK